MEILTEEHKKQLDKQISEFEIDIEELNSAEYDYNIYGVEDHLAVGGWTWDEEEERNLQIQKLKDGIKADGIGEFLKLTEEQWENEEFQEKLENEAIEYLESLEI